MKDLDETWVTGLVDRPGWQTHLKDVRNERVLTDRKIFSITVNYREN